MARETGDHATRLSSQLFKNYRNSELDLLCKRASGKSRAGLGPVAPSPRPIDIVKLPPAPNFKGPALPWVRNFNLLEPNPSLQSPGGYLQ